MKRILAFALLVPSLAFAQGLTPSPPGGGPTYCKPITETSGVIAHAYWKGAVTTDSASVAWTEVGTVPRVKASKKTRPGAGPFAAANYFKNDALTFAASNFTICGVFKTGSDVTSLQAIAAKNSGPQYQFDFYVGGGAVQLDLYQAGGAATTVQQVAALTANQLHVACVSYTYVASGSSILRLMVDKVTPVSFAQSTIAKGPVPAATTYFAIGRREAAGSPTPFLGTIYEVIAWNRALSDGEMLAIQTAVTAQCF